MITEKDKAIEVTDQNKNKLMMNDQGIELYSPKDIKLVAKGKIELTATQDIKIDGMNVEAKAKMEFKAEGSAGAKLKSGGITEIKGSMVNIN